VRLSQQEWERRAAESQRAADARRIKQFNRVERRERVEWSRVFVAFLAIVVAAVIVIRIVAAI
jgi:hypothetical protein